MKEVAREFLAKLSAEEGKLVEKMQLDEAGEGLITAIKEFDNYYYNLVRHERSEEADHCFHIMQLGLPRLIVGIFAEIPRFKYPVITFKSSQLQIRGALEMVFALGCVEQGRRFAQGALAGECEIRRSGERQYDVVMPNPNFKMEQHEANVEYHYRRIGRHKVDEAINETLQKASMLDHINVLLRNHVYVFREHFIGYDAHPDLDEFFFTRAYQELQFQIGYDTYDEQLRFGGVTMQKYVLATIYLLSLALKHERFASTLVEKAPEIRLRDVLTITSEKSEFEESMVAALNMYGPLLDGFTPLTCDEARTILRVLSVRRDNSSVLSSTMAPMPFLIEYSETAWINSTAAIQLGAIDFLLNSLKHNFAVDYARNQQTREGSMQRALRRILNNFLPGLKLVDNVRIRRDGRTLTDIDFVTIDEADGTVVLWQLKHQEHYGGDMRRRSNRASKLRREVDHWLATARAWIAEEEISTVNSAFRLRKGVTLQRVYFVVVAKYFAHFLSSSDLGDDAAYTTWMQLVDALNRSYFEEGPHTLTGLFGTLQRYMSHKVARAVELDEVVNYHLPNLSYRVRPAATG